MKHEIKNYLTNRVQFTAEIDADDNTTYSVKLGLAVLKAVAEGANLRGSNLIGANLIGADLGGANLGEANLRVADLRGTNLRGADLRDANLIGANLRGADLSDDVPVIPNIHQVVYQAASARGALNMSSWHSCDTTHCRAGWVITLAGEAGRKLEESIGASAAAALIYAKSDPCLDRVPDFYTSNLIALDDMRKLAEKEALSQDVATQGKRDANQAALDALAFVCRTLGWLEVVPPYGDAIERTKECDKAIEQCVVIRAALTQPPEQPSINAELLGALKDLKDAAKSSGYPHEAIKRAEQAIARAEQKGGV